MVLPSLYHFILDPTLEFLLNPPVVCSTYKRTSYDLVIGFRMWGLLYKAYDLGDGIDLGWTPPVLESTSYKVFFRLLDEDGHQQPFRFYGIPDRSNQPIRKLVTLFSI